MVVIMIGLMEIWEALFGSYKTLQNIHKIQQLWESLNHPHHPLFKAVCFAISFRAWGWHDQGSIGFLASAQVYQGKLVDGQEVPVMQMMDHGPQPTVGAFPE